MIQMSYIAHETLDADDWREVRKGRLCPQCLGTDEIEQVTSAPDGRAMNYGYNCMCGAQWEGD